MTTHEPSRQPPTHEPSNRGATRWSTRTSTANRPSAAPCSELSDEELEQQGKNAHDTRNWVFLNGTAEQFATHTSRMLELEQEYLRRHPKRTWQGSGGAPDRKSDVDVLARPCAASSPSSRRCWREPHNR